MMTNKRRGSIIQSLVIGALAIVLATGFGIGIAWSYFTTYATAKGGVILHLGDETELKESVVDGKKRVQITADAESAPVFVRVKGLCAEGFSLEYSCPDNSNSWVDLENYSKRYTWENQESTKEKDKEYLYYIYPLSPTKSTEVLDINILDKDGMPMKDKVLEEGSTFNIIIVYETTQALYDEDGNPYPDWNAEVDVYRTEGGSGS